MYATIPIYYPSLEEATRNNETQLWFESYGINLSCKEAIEDRAATAYNGCELDEFIKDLVSNYGVERAMYVLARTVTFSEWDSRIGLIVRENAKDFDFPDVSAKSSTNDDLTEEYVTALDPCIINAMYLKLMGMENAAYYGLDTEDDFDDELILGE